MKCSGAGHKNDRVKNSTTPGVMPGIFSFWIAKAGGKWYNIRKVSRNGRGKGLTYTRRWVRGIDGN